MSTPRVSPALATRPRSRLSEWAVLASGGLSLAGCTWHAARQSSATLQLGLWWVYTGLASLSLGFVLTLFPRSRIGVGFTVGLAGFAVGMAGQHDAPRAPFALVCALYIVCAQYALRRADPTRPAPRLAAARRGLTPVIAVGALASAGALALALPPTHRAFVHAATTSMYRSIERAGLSDRLELGALEGLFRSERIVLRIEGNEPQFLRGVVYDTYRRGRWRSMRSQQDRPAAIDEAAVPSPAVPTRGFFVEQRVQGPWRTYCVPLGYAGPALAQVRGLRTDAYGVLHPAAGEMADRIALDFGPAAPAPSPGLLVHAVPAAPDELDLVVPEGVRAEVSALAAEWQGDAREPAQIMAALERRLARANRYSLEVPAPAAGRDPVLAFLFDHRRGHCEYFASALALLGRAAGVPTRVVAGYRGGDRNAVGGYFVVRDRHAHSWVEAYVPERGWRTYDATPPSGDAPMLSRPVPWASAVWDTTFARLGAFWRWLRARPPTDAIYVAAVLAAGFGLSRLRRRRARDDDAGFDRFARPLAAEPTPASYEALCRALEARGVARSPAETLERYATRVADAAALSSPERAGPRAAAALRSYASLRYGSEGDAAAVERALGASAAELVGTSSAGIRPGAPR